jgi:hypothetical protein
MERRRLKTFGELVSKSNQRKNAGNQKLQAAGRS